MFSVLTPTYNRAHTLKRVFDSLKAQTFQDFEWIIIDDASSDETSKLIDSWEIVNLPFSVKYLVLPENKGKPNALNVGLNHCNKEITIIADSDDTFVPNTFQELYQLWSSVNITKNADKIATIWTLVKDEDNNLVGEKFPDNFWQVDFNNRVLKKDQRVAGEKWHSWRTEVLKKYKMFHSDQSFISESATWNRINKDYDYLCVNVFHRVYYSSPDGYIQKKKTRLELEKVKYYNAYYQLYETTISDIYKFEYFRSYAFDYIKSRLTFKDSQISLDRIKTINCLIIALGFIPKKINSFIKQKS
ncbi:glycosyltransferase family 2 protein [uncultured Maribacter sp.]|uniref:glycosyltransferase family 2 protein n=1 Tax=uncultured Maribacter sp. TaxID=431308 RepID=UPI0026224948|nr:glycosyltransferase family 2 protein [uncultured Maribacter sp.]